MEVDGHIRVEQVRLALQRAKRALKAAEGDLTKHSTWRESRRHADLLATWLHTITPRTTSAQLLEYQSDGSQALVTITLDPALSPSANLTAMHELASKGERGERMAAQRVADLRERVAKAEAELQEAEIAVSEAKATGDSPTHNLSSIKHVESPKPPPHQPLTTRPDPPAYRGADAIEKHLRPRVCHAEDGTLILVGRTSAGNDLLTMRLANGNDWFFHVAGTPGSHVILRWTNKSSQPPTETMEAAAMLALHFSKMKDSSRAAVTYCQRKYVQKPKGAAPGLVYVSKAKTMTVRRDPARLARLLAKEVESE